MPPDHSPGIVLTLLQGVGGTLAGLLWSPGSMFSVMSLLSAACIAVAALALRRRARGRTIRARLLLRALLPRRILRSASTRADAGFFLLNTFVTASLIGWAILSSVTVSQWIGAGLSHAFGPVAPSAALPWLAGTVQTLLLFLAYEFGYWLDHYLKHKIPFLWEFHRVHHTAETLSPLTVFRVHPIDTLVFVNILVVTSSLTTGVAGYLLGGGSSEVTLFGTNVIMLGFAFTVQHLQHSHIWIAFTGVWGRIFASPAHHQIHHSADPAHFGKNLGSFLAVWDWLFDTLHVPQRTREAMRYGVEPGRDNPHGITGSLVTPCIRSAQQVLVLFNRRRAPRMPRSPSANDDAATARMPDRPVSSVPASHSAPA